MTRSGYLPGHRCIAASASNLEHFTGMYPFRQNLRPIFRNPELRILLFLAIFMAFIGMLFPGAYQGTPHFFQELFGPAVLFACGQGFANPVLDDAPALHAFLHPEMHVTHPPAIDACDCADLPADIRTQPIESFQHRQLYLLWAAALVWRVFGVAWSALVPLYGLLFAGAAIAAYGLFRVAMPRAIACALTLLLMLSPVQLDNLLRLRDFSKAPFILGAILCIALLVRGPFHRKRILFLSAACGALIGIGCGFRMDTLIAIPPFAAVLFLFTTARPWHRLRRKVAALGVFALAFIVTSAPILFAMDTSMKYQDFLLGMNDLYDSRLGVGGTPYQLGHRYFDREPAAILQFYAAQRDGEVQHFEFDTPEYEAIGRDLVHELVWTFPADYVVRAYAAVLRTLDELHAGPSRPAPRGVTNAFVIACYDLHQTVTGMLLRYARYAAPLALLLLAARRLRYGFAAFTLLFWFGGYGAVQFASRHYFHMQFLSFWAVGFLLAWAWGRRGGVFNTRSRQAALGALRWPRLWRAPVCRRAVIFTVTTLLLLTVPLAALRAFQRATVPGMLAQYTAAPTEEVETRLTTQEHGVRIQPLTAAFTAAETFTQSGDPAFGCDYFVAEFDTAANPVTPTMLYEGAVPDLAISWQADLPATGIGTTRLYFPAFYARWKGKDAGYTNFAGIELPNADAFMQLKRIPKTSMPAIPLTITTVNGELRGMVYQSFQR